MQVALGRKGDYSVRAMLDITKHAPEGRRKAREIASSMDVPDRYLTQILANLVNEGLLKATAGPDGGYSLTRPAEAITLLDVVEASEGPILLEECVLKGGPCEWEEACPVHTPWVRAQDAVKVELSNTTFAALASFDADIESGDYEAPAGSLPHAIKTQRAPRPS